MLKIGLGSPQYGLFTAPSTISGFAATVPLPQLAYVIGQIRPIAEAKGRDPDALRAVIRVNPVVTAEAAPSDAVPRRGMAVQVSDYLLATHAAGATRSSSTGRRPRGARKS